VGDEESETQLTEEGARILEDQDPGQRRRIHYLRTARLHQALAIPPIAVLLVLLVGLVVLERRTATTLDEVRASTSEIQGQITEADEELGTLMTRSQVLDGQLTSQRLRLLKLSGW